MGEPCGVLPILAGGIRGQAASQICSTGEPPRSRPTWCAIVTGCMLDQLGSVHPRHRRLRNRRISSRRLSMTTAAVVLPDNWIIVPSWGHVAPEPKEQS